MHIRKKWITALCCICLACIMCATTIGCSFNSAVDGSANLQAPKSKLENVTGKYDVSNLATSNFNDSVTKLDAAQTEISVIIDLGGKGLYDIYDRTESFSDFVSSPRAAKYLKTLTKQQNAFISALQKSGIDYTYRGGYTSVTNAVALRISSADFYKIGRIEGVKNVYRNEIYAVPESVDIVENNTPVYTTGVYDSSEAGYKGDGMLVAVLDTGLDYTHDAFQNMPDMNNTTWNHDKVASKFNVNTPLYVQSLGYSVDDVFVNNKVPYAFDYADDDSDVYPSYSNHGTHVAGIIAGRDDSKKVDSSDESKRFIGVAPNAQLAIMKVFTDNLESKMLGGADSVDILHAIDDCAKLGVDVINMSLGSAGGFADMKSDNYVTQIYKDIENLGISLIVAAGNEYSSGFGGGNGTNLASNPDSGTIGSPASYEAALAVASIEGQKAPYIIGNAATSESVAFITNSSDAYGNELDFIGSLYDAVNAWNAAHGRPSVSDSQPLTLNYVVIGGVGNLMNYTSGIRRQLNSEPTIALIKRGDISFADKVQYAKDNGAVACVVYNNLSGTIRMSLGDLVDSIPACSIGLEAGTNLINDASNGRGQITVSKEYSAGPFMSEFSSWGPTPSLTLKPEITAYGGKILSAIPGGYDQQSGTSMASPNMAGMVALMRQYVNKTYGLTGDELNARVYQMLMSTATLVRNDEGNPYSPRKQGAGLGNLQAALNTGAYITVNDAEGNVLPKTKIELFDDPERTGAYEMEFTVHNISNSAVSYLPNVYVMTETLAVDGRTVSEKAHMLTDSDIEVYVNNELSSGRVTVPADSSVTVKVTLKLGAAGRKYIEDSFKNGMYVEGFVRFENGLTSADKEICDIGVPYLAFYGDWADAPMFDYTVFDISENENDSSVEWEDKIHASAAATTPLGMYDEQFIIALGSYVYTMEDTDVAINTSDERAAVSMFNEDYGPIKAINEFYGVYAGLLRGAKEMDISIVELSTGETVFSNTVYNQRKSYAGGGSNYGSPVMLEVCPYDWNWNNNSQYQMTLTGRLDWQREGSDKLVSPDNNTFSFKFTVDYEAPTITDYRVRFEPYTENRETKYRIYMDVDVFDNQYAMALMPSFIEKKADGTNEIKSLTRYPLPVYSQKNSVTTVSFEITDYYEDYFLAGNFFLYPVDYAMNHSLYRVTPDDSIDYPESITFDTSDNKLKLAPSGGDSSYPRYNLELAPNELYKLVQTDIQPEGTVNHKLTWEVTKLGGGETKVKAYESEIFAGGEVVNNVQLRLMAGSNILAEIMVRVRGDAQAEPRLQSIAFRPLYNGDDYVAAVGMSIPLKNNTQTQLVVETTPWYYGAVELEWASTNERVATVDSNGVVSSHAAGSAWISATVKDRPTVRTSVQVVVDSDYNIINYRLYDYYGGEVAEIPDELNIMYLDEECFRDNKIIRKVVLPETLTEIPEGAFMGCTNLEEIVIPASCRIVLNNAFEGCTKLKKVTLSKFKNKVDEDITIGSLTLGVGAFYGCTSLAEFVNPERITTLGSGAFQGCTGLVSMDISGLRIAGDQIFSGCTSLTNVTMSAQTQLGRNMFSGCTKLNNVVIKAEELPYGLFRGCTSLSNVSFDSEVNLKSIGELAFYNCTALQTITLPDGEYSIGADAFSGCTNLSAVNLSQGTRIANDLYTPFSACGKLGAINVAQGNAYYCSESGVLYNVDKTELILVPVLAEFDPADIPSTVKRIASSAFAGNKNLKNIDLTAFEKVGDYAFAQTNLTSVVIPENWTEVPSGLFYGCSNLASVSFAGNSVKTIGADAFNGCESLISVSLPESLTAIGDGAFMESGLNGELNLPNVKSFGSYSFAGTRVSSINAPQSAVLSDFAFIQMNYLTTVTLGAITEMGESVFCSIGTSNGQSTLIGNKSIQSVIFGEGTKVVGAYAFAIENTNGHLTNVVLPDSVEKIGEYAFMNRLELRSVNLRGVKKVGEQAFMRTGLTNADLRSVRELGIASFAYTSSLKSVDLSNVEIVGGSAFEGSGIESVTLSKVSKIDDYAFAETKIKKVVIPASFDSYTYKEDNFYRPNDAGDMEKFDGRYSLSLSGSAFALIPTLTEFEVEQGNDTFFADDGVLYARVKEGYVLVCYPMGKQDVEYEVLEGTVRIGDYAFYNMPVRLATVTFPVSLKAIGAFAFYNNDAKGNVTREYVFKAVEAPVLESIYAVTSQYVQANENNIIFMNTLNLFSTLYYANFGNFAGLAIEEDHVRAQLQWLKEMGENVDRIAYIAPTFNYKITRPSNGVGYDNPIWTTYFSAANTTLSAYAADRTTVAAINAINGAMSAEQIKTEIDAIVDKQAKLARLNAISKDVLSQARQAYNRIVDDRQKTLAATDYAKLLAAEKAVRDMKSEFGSPVALTELRREGSYKLRYEEGEKFDPQSMKVIAVYEDGSLLELDSSTYTLDKTGALTAADSQVTISYGGKTLILGISVTAATDPNPGPNPGPDDPGPDNPGSPVNVGLIVGLSVGGAVLAAGIAVLAVFLVRKRKHSVNKVDTDGTNKVE